MNQKCKWGRITGVFLCLLSFVGLPYFLTAFGVAVYIIFALHGQTLQISICASAFSLVAMITIFIIGFDAISHYDEEDCSDPPYPTLWIKLAAVASFGAGAGVLALLMLQDNAPVIAYLVIATLAAWIIMLFGWLARRHYDRAISIEILGPGELPRDAGEQDRFIPDPRLFESATPKPWPRPHPIHGTGPTGEDHH